MTQSNEIFARNLKHYMDLHEKTQKEMAKIIGVSAPTVHDWLKAKMHPRMDKVELIAQYFNITKADLIEEQSAAPSLIPLEEVGQKIRAQREQLGFSRKYISERTSLSEATLKRWESGTYNPMPDEAEQLSQILHLSREYLMGIQADEKNIRRQRFRTMLYEELPDLSLTDDEIRQVINYIKFVISQRK